MADIEYTETDERGLDLIEPLWQKLNDYHGELSEYFAESYPKNTFVRRKKELLEKSNGGTMRIDLARDIDAVKLIGYCVSTLSRHKKGEIDSIFVEDGYRRSGIGDCLMKKALRWMEGKAVERKVVEVIVNNEEALRFYERYGFYPRATILAQVEGSQTDSS